MDRKAFFDAVRKTLFGGHLKQSQVDGLSIILDACAGISDPRQAAYILATAFHETARTMQPIREYGRGRGRPYGRADSETGNRFYGRGFVQLTWKANYARVGEEIGVDLVHFPDKAMEPAIAARVLVEGMSLGWFTGKKLSDYFGGKKAQWKNARRIVNGMDRASLIAGYATKFHSALRTT